MIENRVKHFSHNDADGAGAVILSKRVFAHVDYEMCSYENINERVERFVENYMNDCTTERYQYLIITDISLNETVAELVDYLSIHCPETIVMLLDHHEKVDWLNKYPWATVTKFQTLNDAEQTQIKTSGTFMWYTWLVDNGYFPNGALEEYTLSETIRQWDTWDWTVTGNKRASELSSLLYIVGKEAYVNRFTENPSIELTEREVILLENEDVRIKLYTEEKIRDMKLYKTGSGLTAGVIFAEQHLSVIGYDIIKKCPHVDFLIMIVPSKGRASLRTLRNDLDMGIIAQKFGGNGHPKSAGCPTTKLFQYAIDLQEV